MLYKKIIALESKKHKLYTATVESQYLELLDKLNSRCLEQNNRSHPYQFTQNEYSISRTLDVSNKYFGPMTVRDIEIRLYLFWAETLRLNPKNGMTQCIS